MREELDELVRTAKGRVRVVHVIGGAVGSKYLVVLRVVHRIGAVVS